MNEDYSRSVLPPSALDNLDENWLNDPVPVDARNINIGAKKLQNQAQLLSPPLSDNKFANKKKIEPVKK